MKIKEQIQKKIAEYKKDFYEECGFHIIVIPQVGIPKMPLYEVINLACDFLDTQAEKINTRSKVSIKSKEFVFGVCSKMGFEGKELYKALELDRTSMYNLKDRFENKLKTIRAYKYEFYKFIEYLYENSQTETYLNNTEKWEEKAEYLDTLYLEELPT